MMLFRFLIERMLRYASAFMLAAALMLAVTGCGKSSTKEQTAGNAKEAESQQPDNTGTADYGHYDESVAANEHNDNESPYLGIMHATVLEVNGSIGDSRTVYSFKDKSDPDNAWSVTGLEIGDIEVEIQRGLDVAILFQGDIIRDSENLIFIAVLPDGHYTIKSAKGITSANVMSSFTVKTAKDEEIQFIKDNCRMDEGALSKDSGDSVIVYYADGGSLGNYPMRIYKKI